MDLHNITPIKGSNKKASKRVGRGQGSGKGGTSTRGHKGAKSRSGYSRKIGFEGGQMPLQRRVPKFGFKNINRIQYQILNLEKIQELVSNKKIKNKLEIEKIYSLGLAKKNSLVKILGKGKILSPIEITAHKFSGKAQKEIESAGGKINLILKNE
tara:strand:+ start:318 stop:782 length:465 start_codon:yes stop_codon:yes gene_type:complete